MGATGVVGLGSTSKARGDAIVAALGEGEGAFVSGGGSIAANDVGGLDGTAGPGRSGMSPSALVSMVISFVSDCTTRSA
jgi:hypothetical protein